MRKVRERSGPYTFEEFCRIVRPDQKADLIDGVIHLSAPEDTGTNQLFGWLAGLIADYVEERELGRVFAGRVALRLDERNGPEPDILFLRTENEDRIRREYVDGPADLIVEIIAPDSVVRDYEKKRHQYEQFGITEYWIVDEELQEITLLRLNAKGKYREVKPHEGPVHSEVLTGFWLKPEWLWEDPRPKKREILNLLLDDSEAK
jgi:Uma2 family endonuclease